MKTYIKINEILYPAKIVSKKNDADWDNRSSKIITLQMSYEEAINIFVDNIIWYIVQEVEEVKSQYDEQLKQVIQKIVVVKKEYDNSQYNMAGDIIDHRDGYISVKMGKPLTDDEKERLIQENKQLKEQNAEYESAFIEIETALEV